MTYIVTDACIRCKYMDCVEVCPVDCFYEGENMLVIHPDECIDCGVCEPECPAEAILPEIDPDRDTAVALATEVLEGFVERYQGAWSHGMAAKLGLEPDRPGNSDLFDGLVSLQTAASADRPASALADAGRAVALEPRCGLNFHCQGRALHQSHLLTEAGAAHLSAMKYGVAGSAKKLGYESLLDSVRRERHTEARAA